MTSAAFDLRLLGGMEDPLFVIDAHRRVLFQNGAGRRIGSLGYGARVRAGLLSLEAAADTLRLEQLLRDGGARACGGLRLAAATGGKDWLLLCTHIEGKGATAAYLLHLVRRLGPRRLPHAAIRDLFRLTPRELTVVEQLVTGATLREIALTIHLSHESVRVYVKRIFRKCDVHSQTELVALVQRLSLFAPHA